MRLVPVTMGVHTHYTVLDDDGYPVAQGSLETCKLAMGHQPGEEDFTPAPEPYKVELDGQPPKAQSLLGPTGN